LNNKKCLIIRAGLVDYSEALDVQKKILQLKMEERMVEDIVFFLEHPPTITIGKKGSLDELLVNKVKLEEKGIFTCHIGRGGKVTYHGPGQLVGYPLLNLIDYGKDLHFYLRNIEEVIIRTLKEFGVETQRKKGLTGVWVQNKKIASIGVQVKRWISMHGFALNVNCDLGYFNLIQPCGMKSGIMTSLVNILGNKIKLEDVEENMIINFAKVFMVKTEKISFHQLKEKISYQVYS